MSHVAPLEAISQRFPALLARLEKAELSSPAIEHAAKSSNWERLIERWLEGVELQEGSAIALSGFGDGSHVLALLRKLPSSARVFCAEENLGNIVAASSASALAACLEDPRFFLGVGALDKDFFAAMEHFPVLEATDASALVFAPLFNASPDYYARFFVEFARSLDYWRKLKGTNMTRSRLWQANTLANAHALIGAPDVSAWRDAFEGETMLLVSAGPSLDESLEFVRSQQERCLVVAVNSSYRALRNAGIIPHFVLAADPNESTGKGFDGVPCDETILLCPFIVAPDVVPRFAPRIGTWSFNNLLASYLRLRLGLGAGSEVLEHGTVAACAFDIANLMGLRRMVLVGQDMAIKEDGQSHASDSFYADKNQHWASVEKCRQLPGNTIESVPVEEKLYVYLKTFESLVAQRASDLEVLNVSRLGARIEGAAYLSLDEAEALLGKEDRSSLAGKLEKTRTALVSSTSLDERLDKELVAMEAFAMEVVSLSFAAAVGLEADDADEAALARAKEAKAGLGKLFEKEPALEQVLRDGALKQELMRYEQAGGKDTEAADLREYLWAMAEGAFVFASDIRTSIEESA